MREAQMEAARVWNDVKDFHLFRRATTRDWPTRDELRQLNKSLLAETAGLPLEPQIIARATAR